jgi:hypothetical protein
LVVVLVDSPKEDRLLSSELEVKDPSPIDDIGFCGMNFFNTPLLL